MKPGRRVAIPIFAALLAGLALAPAFAAEPTATSNDRPDEFIVRAKALEELRLRIKVAENDAYERFNELNTDHSHDVHCFDRAPTGSRISKRSCVSNAWRQADAAIAQAYLRGLQSVSFQAPLPGAEIWPDASVRTAIAGYGAIPGKYRANQRRTEDMIMKELGKAANTDPALHDAMQRIGQAHLALEAATGSHADYTMYRDVAAGDEGLPFGAKRALEVRVGDVAWNHPLTSRTFTIGSVTGRIKGLRLRCDTVDKNLDYDKDSEWTVPQASNDCSLVVRADRGTTFALYEF